MTDKRYPGSHPVVLALIVLLFFSISIIVGVIIYNAAQSDTVDIGNPGHTHVIYEHFIDSNSYNGGSDKILP